MPLIVERLRADHEVLSFRNTREPEIERYLREQALDEQNVHASATYVLLDSVAPNVVLGYFTLSPAAIRLTNLPQQHVGLVPQHYPALGAFLLARMGIRDEDRGTGRRLGTTLLEHAYRRAVRLIYQSGGIGLVVDPKNPALVEYYKKHGFTPLERMSGLRMFIHFNAMVEIVGEADASENGDERADKVS